MDDARPAGQAKEEPMAHPSAPPKPGSCGATHPEAAFSAGMYAVLPRLRSCPAVLIMDRLIGLCPFYLKLGFGIVIFRGGLQL